MHLYDFDGLSYDEIQDRMRNVSDTHISILYRRCFYNGKIVKRKSPRMNDLYQIIVDEYEGRQQEGDDH